MGFWATISFKMNMMMQLPVLVSLAPFFQNQPFSRPTHKNHFPKINLLPSLLVLDLIHCQGRVAANDK
jgi:hypothetical protein